MPPNVSKRSSRRSVSISQLPHHVPLIETSNIRSQITHNLRAAILAGEMKVGQVYSAPTLANLFGVSATPVREAMIDLAKEGIVEVVRNKGFTLVQPGPDDLRQMMEARLLLEVPTIRAVAARGLSNDQRQAAEFLAEASLEAAQRNDLTSHVAADMRFHLYLLGLSGNEHIVDIVRVLRSRGRLYGLHSRLKRSFLLESAKQHVALVKLMADRQDGRAADLIHTHIRQAGEEWSDPSFEDR